MSVCTWRASWLVALGLTAVGCAEPTAGEQSPGEEPAAEPEVEGRDDNLYVDSPVIWSEDAIKVCWEDGGAVFSTEKAWAKDAVFQTWAAESNIRFTGWGNCPSTTFDGLRVKWINDTAFTQGRGTKLRGVKNGVNLDTYQHQPDCGEGWTREACVRAVSVHEFGHALGFIHEQSRKLKTGGDPTAPTDGRSCLTKGLDPDRDKNGVLIGDWDERSVMNYCNDDLNGNGRLSGTDIWGLQKYYGAPRSTSTVVRQTGRLDIFARGTDNKLSQKTFNGSAWSTASRGGFLTSSPAAVSWGTGRIDVFARGKNGDLVHMFIDGSFVSGWESLGGLIRGAPAVVSWGPGRLDVFARGEDDALHHRWFENGWGDWEQLSSDRYVGTPHAVSWGPGRLDVFVRHANSSIRHIQFNGNNWMAPIPLPGGKKFSSSPTAVTWGVNRLDAFARGEDDSVWHWWRETTTTWSQPENLGNGITFASDLAVLSRGPGLIDIFARETGPYANLSWQRFDGSSWVGWGPIGGSLGSGPSAVSMSANRIDIFAQKKDNTVQQYFRDGNTAWGTFSLGMSVF